MNLGQALGIGYNGLSAAAAGAAVSGHNATNVSTPGYTRQQVIQRGRPFQLGGGVEFTEPQRIVDGFADRRLNAAISLDGEAAARAETLSVLDRVFADTDGSVGSALDRFENALSAFADVPGDGAVRVTLLGATEQLAQSFNRAGGELADARVQVNDQIVHEVEVINGQLSEIGALNRQIREGNAAGQDVATLMDSRDQLIRDVAERVPITTLLEEDGPASVLLSGSRILVSANGTARALTTTVDADGDRRVLKDGGGATQDVTALLTSGRLSGLLDARDGSLADARSALDTLASEIAVAYNDVHVTGFGQDGVAGRDLFASVSGDGAALQMAVSADVAGQPQNLAAATAANLSGDNRTALALVAVGDANVAASGTATPAQAYSEAIAQAGTAAMVANRQADHAALSRDQAQSLRDGISGVSSDEEMIHLMRYQRAYQASLRVIETADAMLAELLNLR